MLFLDGAYLLALDGTGYFSSQTIHCHVVSAQGPPQRFHHVLSPDVGRGDYPSGLS